jgi:hypothetical protein
MSWRFLGSGWEVKGWGGEWEQAVRAAAVRVAVEVMKWRRERGMGASENLKSQISNPKFQTNGEKQKKENGDGGVLSFGF